MKLTQYLSQANLAFTGLFTGEMLLKWVAYGVCCGDKAYFKSAWNRLDFFIVMI